MSELQYKSTTQLTRCAIGMKNIFRLEKKSVWHKARERENIDLLCAKSQSAINAKNVHRFVSRSLYLILDDLFLQLMCSMRALPTSDIHTSGYTRSNRVQNEHRSSANLSICIYAIEARLDKLRFRKKKEAKTDRNKETRSKQSKRIHFFRFC